MNLLKTSAVVRLHSKDMLMKTIVPFLNGLGSSNNQSRLAVSSWLN